MYRPSIAWTSHRRSHRAELFGTLASTPRIDSDRRATVALPLVRIPCNEQTILTPHDGVHSVLTKFARREIDIWQLFAVKHGGSYLVSRNTYLRALTNLIMLRHPLESGSLPQGPLLLGGLCGSERRPPPSTSRLRGQHGAGDRRHRPPGVHGLPGCRTRSRDLKASRTSLGI